MQGVSAVGRAGTLPLRWAHSMRYRECPSLDHSRLRWYRDVTSTYRLTAEYILPAGLRLLARLTVEGLANVPLAGPVILAANHRDNLDGPLLMHVVPRTLHFAARPDGFGTGDYVAKVILEHEFEGKLQLVFAPLGVVHGAHVERRNVGRHLGQV